MARVEVDGRDVLLEGAVRRYEASGYAGLLQHWTEAEKSTAPTEIELDKDSSGFIVHVDNG
jgi:hypothetical protein